MKGNAYCSTWGSSSSFTATTNEFFVGCVGGYSVSSFSISRISGSQPISNSTNYFTGGVSYSGFYAMIPNDQKNPTLYSVLNYGLQNSNTNASLFRIREDFSVHSIAQTNFTSGPTPKYPSMAIDKSTGNHIVLTEASGPKWFVVGSNSNSFDNSVPERTIHNLALGTCWSLAFAHEGFAYFLQIQCTSTPQTPTLMKVSILNSTVVSTLLLNDSFVQYTDNRYQYYSSSSVSAFVSETGFAWVTFESSLNVIYGIDVRSMSIQYRVYPSVANTDVYQIVGLQLSVDFQFLYVLHFFRTSATVLRMSRVQLPLGSWQPECQTSASLPYKCSPTQCVSNPNQCIQQACNVTMIANQPTVFRCFDGSCVTGPTKCPNVTCQSNQIRVCCLNMKVKFVCFF